MMKLAFCLFKVYPYGGLERDFLQIAKACQARGHDIHVFTQQWEGEIPPGFHVTFIKPFGFTNASRAKSFAKKLSALLSKTKFDQVIGFNRLPHLDFYFAADPCFAEEAKQKHGFLCKLLRRYKIYAKLEKSVFSKHSTTKILLLNPAHQQDFIQHYQTPKKRFLLLAPGISEDRRRPLDQLSRRQILRNKYNVRDDEKIILMVGSGFKVKGVDRTLFAFQQFPKFLKEKTHLWIVGKGEPTPQEQVTFWGPRQDVVDFYAAADVLVHPSYQETAGMVLLESLVAGLPVVVTQNCGYAVYIQKANAGIVIPEPFSQENLNKSLETILSNESALGNYRQNALNFCKSHDLFHLAKQVADIIEHEGKK